METGFVALMYHEIGRPGISPCDGSPGYLRYVVPEIEFRQQLRALQEEGLRGSSMQALLEAGHPPESSIAITFDDGCRTDLTVAAPALRDAGFGATCFIVPEFLGQPGYLTGAEVRELAEAGFEIGSHGLSHRFLTLLGSLELDRELRESKAILEALIGAPVLHLSCPGGRWSRSVADHALALGYRWVSTSRVGRNSPSTGPTRLARLAVRGGLTDEAFRRRSRGEGLAREQWRAALLGGARRTLGDKLYDSLQRRFG